MSSVVEFEPVRVPHVDLNNKHQFSRLERRLRGFEEILPGIPEGEGFRERYQSLRKLYDLYESHVTAPKGPRAKGVGDAMFLFGMIGNFDKEIEKYWGEKLRGSQLAGILPHTFSLFARSKGLTSKVNRLINQFSGGKLEDEELKGKIDAALAGQKEPVFVGITLDNLLGKYKELRRLQYSEANVNIGYIHGLKLNLEKLWKGLTVVPRKDRTGRNVRYQLKRFDRRMNAVKGTEFEDEEGFKSFNRLQKEAQSIMKSDIGDPEGKAVMAQGLNIQFSDLARDWMNERIERIKRKIPDGFKFSEVKAKLISGLENFASSISHVGRKPGLVREILDRIDGFLKVRKVDYSFEVENFWDDLNRKLATSKYRSHSGEMVSFGTLANLRAGYKMEDVLQKKHWMPGRIESLVKGFEEKLGEKPSEKKFGEMLAEAVHSKEFGLPEAQVVTRKLMDKAPFKVEKKFRLEKKLGEEFRQREKDDKDRDDLLLVLNMAAGGGDEAGNLLADELGDEEFREKMTGDRRSANYELLLSIPRVRELAGRVLKKEPKEVTEGDIVELSRNALAVHVALNAITELWWRKKEHRDFEFMDMLKSGPLRVGLELGGAFAPILNAIRERGYHPY